MLTAEQKQQVAGWFAAGASLDEIQKRVKAEFGVHMTYLDVRLMVAELPQPAEPEPEPPPEPADVPAAPQGGVAGDAYDYPGAQGEGGAPVPGAQGNVPGAQRPEPPPGAPKRYDLDAPDADEGKAVPDVAVSVDTVVDPRFFASGDVTFSDGVTAKWYVSQDGRLGLDKIPEGYRPSPTDGVIFQQRLMEELRNRGMM